MANYYVCIATLERRDANTLRLTWTPNGWSRTMGYIAWISGRSNAEQPPFGLYLGSHDPLGRLKMLPAAIANHTTAAGTGGTGEVELAVLRALHTHPKGFASDQPLVMAYPVVLQAFRGG